MLVASLSLCLRQIRNLENLNATLNQQVVNMANIPNPSDQIADMALNATLAHQVADMANIAARMLYSRNPASKSASHPGQALSPNLNPYASSKVVMYCVRRRWPWTRIPHSHSGMYLTMGL